MAAVAPATRRTAPYYMRQAERAYVCMAAMVLRPTQRFASMPVMFYKHIATWLLEFCSQHNNAELNGAQHVNSYRRMAAGNAEPNQAQHANSYRCMAAGVLRPAQQCRG